MFLADFQATRRVEARLPEVLELAEEFLRVDRAPECVMAFEYTYDSGPWYVFVLADGSFAIRDEEGDVIESFDLTYLENDVFAEARR